MLAGLGMGSADSKIHKASANAEKKALKTAAKLAKKTGPGADSAAASVDRLAGPMPGERSAAAAEKNVAVHQRRFLGAGDCGATGFGSPAGHLVNATGPFGNG